MTSIKMKSKKHLWAMETFSIGTAASTLSRCCRNLIVALMFLGFACFTAYSQAEENKKLPLAKDVSPELYSTGFETADGLTFGVGKLFYVGNYRGNGKIGTITTEGKASLFCDLNEIAKVEGAKPLVAGMKIDVSTRLIVADAGAGRLLRISSDGKKAEILADRYMDSRLHSVKDVALDINGNIYFTDTGGKDGLTKSLGALYRYDIKTRELTLIAKGLAFPTGLAVLHRETKAVAKKPIKLVIAESHKHQLLVFDLLAKGKVSAGKVLFKFPEKTEGGIAGGKI